MSERTRSTRVSKSGHAKTKALTSRQTKAVQPARSAGTFPMTPDAIRQNLLLQAGVDEAKQVHLVKRVVEGIERDLDAEKTEVIVDKLGHVHRENVRDNVARAKAREQALDLVGARAPRTNATQTVRHVVSIEWPEWAKPSEPEPKVIDAAASRVE